MLNDRPGAAREPPATAEHALIKRAQRQLHCRGRCCFYNTTPGVRLRFRSDIMRQPLPLGRIRYLRRFALRAYSLSPVPCRVPEEHPNVLRDYRIDITKGTAVTASLFHYYSISTRQISSNCAACERPPGGGLSIHVVSLFSYRTGGGGIS